MRKKKGRGERKEEGEVVFYFCGSDLFFFFFCGSSSVDRASAFQAEGRGFESRLPLI